jgi:hypothetical protein
LLHARTARVLRAGTFCAPLSSLLSPPVVVSRAADASAVSTSDTAARAAAWARAPLRRRGPLSAAAVAAMPGESGASAPAAAETPTHTAAARLPWHLLGVGAGAGGGGNEHTPGAVHELARRFVGVDGAPPRYTKPLPTNGEVHVVPLGADDEVGNAPDEQDIAAVRCSSVHVCAALPPERRALLP